MDGEVGYLKETSTSESYNRTCFGCLRNAEGFQRSGYNVLFHSSLHSLNGVASFKLC